MQLTCGCSADMLGLHGVRRFSLGFAPGAPALTPSVGECLPGARPARYFCINYPDFSPRFTLPWRSPPK